MQQGIAATAAGAIQGIASGQVIMVGFPAMMALFGSPRGGVACACLVLFLSSAPPTASAAEIYFVREGDTLAGISRTFGVAIDRLRQANDLQHTDIKPGDRVLIPQPTSGLARIPEAPRRDPLDSDRMLQALCRNETVYHAVAKGDTLSSIARRYSARLVDLLRLNGLSKRSRLSIGQKVLVRRSGPRSHTVRRGETLHRIAARFGTKAAELSRLNRLDGEKLTAGQRLLIDPCDPYSTAGSAPPPLGGPEADAREADDLLTSMVKSAAAVATEEAAETANPTVSSVAQRVIRLARTMLDIPYRFGGTTLRGIDCSAYVQRVFGLLDVQIPRTAREQFGIGERIGINELAVGDLVFFRTYASFPSHVGIYVGDNLFIHASSVVRKVTIDSIDLPYYRKRFLGARRLVADDSPSLAVR